MQQKPNIYRPKIAGIVIASVLLVMMVLLIVVSTFFIVFADRFDKDPTPDANQGTPTIAVTTTKAPQQTTAPDKAPVTEPEIIKPSYIEVDSALIGSGTVIRIDETHLYTREGLINYRDMTADKAEKLGFAVIPESINYSRNNYNLYLTKDACKAFEKMTDQLAEDVGSALHVRYAYYYQAGLESIENLDDLEAFEHSTGLMLDLQCYENGALYNLTHTKQKAYYDWLLENCYKYGFIWVRDKGNVYSTFRYVGVPHAAAMHKMGVDTLTEYHEAIASYTFTGNFKVSDANGNEWWIYYAAAEEGANTVKIAVIGDESNYQISGTNDGGLIVAINSTSFAG